MYIAYMMMGFLTLLGSVHLWNKKVYPVAVQALVIALFFLAIAIKIY